MCAVQQATHNKTKWSLIFLTVTSAHLLIKPATVHLAGSNALRMTTAVNIVNERHDQWHTIYGLNWQVEVSLPRADDLGRVRQLTLEKEALAQQRAQAERAKQVSHAVTY